jgi:3-dehydroquinate synthase
MNLGAVGGFWLARWAGWPLARRFSQPRDLARTRRMALRYGAAALVMFRAVPILAEATVLLAGATRLPWRRFLPPVIAANLGISIVYAVLGQTAKDYDLLPAAIVLSIAIPLTIAMLVRWLIR